MALIYIVKVCMCTDGPTDGHEYKLFNDYILKRAILYKRPHHLAAKFKVKDFTYLWTI